VSENTIIGFLVALALVVVGGPLLTVRCGGAPSEGYSVGTIVNVANEGFLFPRPALYHLHAGEMDSEPFAIEDDKLAAEARRYSETNQRVRLHYREYLVCWRWNYASCTVVDRIEPVTTEKP
jgi:hypothetical protein